MPSISLIAAMTTNDRVIGLNNHMPWHMPADLKHFKQITQNKPVIMGRKTFDSIGRPLPKRRNLVISRNTTLSLPGCDTFTSLDAAIEAVKQAPEIMIIGGSEIYRQALPLASRLYLTFIDIKLEGDAFFPDWTQAGKWHCISEEAHMSDECNPYNYRFVVLEKNNV